jgi:hypothetical protein
MTLSSLIEEIEQQADDPLDRLAAATLRHDDLIDEADQLLDHFVQAARAAGTSWASIGEALGVTKQAAQQRHGAEPDEDDGLGGFFGRKRHGRRRLQRFTDRARNSVTAAQTAARELGHEYVGTEHLLLGLFDDETSIAAKLLAGWSITRADVVSDVEEVIGRGDGAPKGHIPFTPRSKKVLELTLREALALGHNYIGTEHILLGLVRVEDGVAAHILGDRGVTAGTARQAVVDALRRHRSG